MARVAHNVCDWPNRAERHGCAGGWPAKRDQRLSFRSTLECEERQFGFAKERAVAGTPAHVLGLRFVHQFGVERPRLQDAPFLPDGEARVP
jgi:hypothetical protein